MQSVLRLTEADNGGYVYVNVAYIVAFRSTVNGGPDAGSTVWLAGEDQDRPLRVKEPARYIASKFQYSQ